MGGGCEDLKVRKGVGVVAWEFQEGKHLDASGNAPLSAANASLVKAPARAIPYISIANPFVPPQFTDIIYFLRLQLSIDG